jgi:hypothetical protein
MIAHEFIMIDERKYACSGLVGHRAYYRACEGNVRQGSMSKKSQVRILPCSAVFSCAETVLRAQ